ncbi:deoxyribodipyrimidine photo-lyase/cryptochrome family protein [Halovenus halobia]|uniref:cryptochrome/deoxyribodipyrimidine photo-lyase family protein n=1 Tax=Halovenus halobia TaxID=3396622 RepID=UPI003F54595C
MTGHSGERNSTVGDATAVPFAADIPRPGEVTAEPDATGVVVWHRKHLRVEDHRALAEAVADGDVVCPLFVFDPAFYEDGLACDARIRFLHEAVTSLSRLYATTPADSMVRDVPESAGSLGDTTDNSAAVQALSVPDQPGLTCAYGDPVAVLSRFVDHGWQVRTMATPTSRYGLRRDERVREACGNAVEFVSGDGLLRGEEWPRTDWQSHVEKWLAAPQHSPSWDAKRLVLDTGVTPARVDQAFDTAPTKTNVPTGTHRGATTQLREFVDRIGSYPGNISAPGDARDGTSGLSPYLNFGLLSVRQVHQYVDENAPECRGQDMFESRLVWNLHYNQKLADWPGWTDRAVNPVFEGKNSDNHDPELVAAWKRGETGFPMVDASMRCLAETGWLNFRMRAMCASFFAHILKQPWRLGADWYHHHLIDSDVGINYTQWQSQAGLIGKPSQRVYNPRKQVRDQDPDGEWITGWVPELDELPSQFLDQPERTPLSVQDDCGVVIGDTYPRPVVDYEAQREAFWSTYERQRPEAARQLGRPEIAKRASFSGGYGAAQAIAKRYGDKDTESGTQISLSDIVGEGEKQDTAGDTEMSVAEGHGEPDEDEPLPTGSAEQAGEPSPDDRRAVPDQSSEPKGDESDSEQTAIGRFD